MNQIQGTAQIYLIGEGLDTIVHLVNIPSFYGSRSSIYINDIKEFLFNISVYNEFGNLILKKEISLKNFDSIKISLKKLLKNFSKSIFLMGQFVINHNYGNSFLCNFYTSYEQTINNKDFKIFKLHSHQKIEKEKLTINKMKNLVLYALFNLRLYQNIRISKALNSWNNYDFKNKSVNLLIANHGNSKKEHFIIINFLNKKSQKFNNEVIKINLTPFGSLLVNLDSYLNKYNKKDFQKINFNIKGLGTCSKKPILIITKKCFYKTNFYKNEILHMQHI